MKEAGDPFLAPNQKPGATSFWNCKSLYVNIQCHLQPEKLIDFNAPNAGSNTQGKQKRRRSDRFGEHRRAVEKAITQRDIAQPTVSDHFTLPGHSLNNLELIPLELINSNRDAIRKAREEFLTYKGKTLELSG